MKKLLLAFSLLLTSNAFCAKQMVRENMPPAPVPSNEEISRLDAEIKHREEQMHRLVKEIHDLKVRLVKAQATKDNHDRNTRTRTLAEDRATRKGMHQVSH